MRVSAQSGNEAAIKELIDNYAAVVNVEPVDLKLAAQVWSTTPDVTFINPLGEEHGWDAIKQDFYEGIMEKMFSERKLTTRDLKIHVNGNAAWSEFSWHFVATRRQGGSTVQNDGRETQIYRKLDSDHWVLVHVHYSAMPAGR